MAILEIIEAPDPRLKTISEPVTEFDDGLKQLVEDMFETMYAANGIGLAAIQVGVPKRLLVIDLQPEDEDAEPVPCDHDGHHHTHQPTLKQPRIFVNPEILDPGKTDAVRRVHGLEHVLDKRLQSIVELRHGFGYGLQPRIRRFDDFQYGHGAQISTMPLNGK